MRSVVVLAVLAFVALGFVQERLKVSLNYYLEVTASYPDFYELPPDRRDAWLNERQVIAPYDYYYNHERVSWYHQFSRSELQLLKWAFALGFIFIHLALSAAVLLKIDSLKLKQFIQVIKHKEQGKPLRYLAGLYLSALVLALVFFAAMRVVKNPTAAYAVARESLGFMQSPFPLILVLFALRLQGAFR